MEYVFTQVVDPMKKRPKKRFMDIIPTGNKKFIILTSSYHSEHQFQFNSFELNPKKKKPDLTERIDEKLRGTKYTYEILEELYSNDTMFHSLIDLKGNSIWFNQSLMEFRNVTKNDYFMVNVVDHVLPLNPEHPFVDFMLNILQDQPKEARSKKT